jgi:hypothetical protein
LPYVFVTPDQFSQLHHAGCREEMDCLSVQEFMGIVREVLGPFAPKPYAIRPTQLVVRQFLSPEERARRNNKFRVTFVRNRKG